MSLTQISDKDKGDLPQEILAALPTIVSALKAEEKCTKALEYLRKSVTFLPTYSINELDDQLLRHIIPILKNWLNKILIENLTIADTADDDFVIDILKENLKITIELVCLLKTVIEFILQNDEVDIMDIKELILNLGNCLISAFKHCKECPQSYKEICNSELSDLFLVSQELHKLFLRLIESCVVVNEKTEVLNRLLELTCDLSDILSHMNIKSMVDNWKAYTSVSQKWIHILGDSVDLHLPLSNLRAEIYKKLKSLDEIDANLIIQVVKVTSFLVKVFLKLCDIFWQFLESMFCDVYSCCAVIYSFSIDYFIELRFSEELVVLIDKSLFIGTEAFVIRLATENWFLEQLENSTFNFDDKGVFPKSIGHLNCFSLIIKASSSQNIPDFKLRYYTRKIFHFILECEEDLFWKNNTSKLFENLVIHMACTVLLNGKYEDVEDLLLENILHDHTGCSLLALEVWSVILSNSDEQTSVDIFTNLLNFIRKLDWGIFTSRPERINLKHFAARIFQFISKEKQTGIVKEFEVRDNIQLWKRIGLENFPEQQVFVIENLILETVAKIETMRNSCSVEDIVCVGEHLDLLSSANFTGTRLNNPSLVVALNTLWEIELTPDIVENNIFAYFIFKLGKITSALIHQFYSTQVLLVLDQLNILSKHDDYKLLACSVLSAISRSCFTFMFELDDQNKHQLLCRVVNIISRNLIGTSSGVVKQNALELLKRFSANAQYEFVARNVLKALDDQEGRRALHYLQGGYGDAEISSRYLAGSSFRHDCIKWRRTEVVQPACKKVRKDDGANVNKETIRKVPSAMPMNADEEASGNSGGVSEIIDRIKGEVKCLTSALKTDNLSRKNVSDLKLVTNKILSYL